MEKINQRGFSKKTKEFQFDEIFEEKMIKNIKDKVFSYQF